jgi:riboflavin kinase/FMN adenylyltransferase
LNVATIGAFDGVHRGHQCLLKQVRRIADEYGLNALAITFGTSPKNVLGGGDTSQLTYLEERTTLLHHFGMDKVAVLNFTPQMAEMTAREFMQKVLKEQLHVAILVIGYDHRFGRGRSEGFDDYVWYGQEIGIEVVRGEACIEDGEPVSSTRIRHLLEEGEVDEAAQLLGYRYTLRGKVVDGYREGRKMGFPTANIRIDNGQQTTDEEVDCKLIPADGVYAVWVKIDDNVNDNENRHPEDNFQFSIFKVRASEHDVSALTNRSASVAELKTKSNSQFKKGMLNIGYRPTLNNGQERSIEVHILDFEGDLYGKELTLQFYRFLRPEQKFPSLDALKEEIQKNALQTRKFFENNTK